ncbi:MAG: NAD(P)-dependent oxidoreductase [Pseudomonadota bacterium]
MNIGYLGLGNMGGALAARLQLSHTLHVHDLNAPAVERMREKGAAVCSTPAELASLCDVIFLCLPTSEHVRQAIFGASGLAGSLRQGALIVDQTTGDPTVTRAMAAEVSKLGATLIDAPVSGGAKGAEAGTIAIMVGAAADQFARVQPLLGAISPNIFHAGEVGAGQVIKLVNNMMSASYRLLAFEGLALACKNGIDPQTACDILLAGGGRSQYVQKFLEPNVIKGKLHVGFTLGLMLKDVRLACKLGGDSGVPMFLGNQVRELYQMCMNENGFDAQVDTAALVFDRMSGTHVVPEGVTLETVHANP